MQSAVLACAAPGGVGLDGGGGGGDVVMVKRSSLAACLTCPQCGRLFRDAATISECLHTFCRKCVSKEFINKEFCCCPTCNIDLGCASLEKLRVDHSVQYVRSKIFPFKRQEVEDPEVIPPVASPVKRKERSLSSLTIHAPRVSIQKCLRRGEQKLHSYAALLCKDTAKKVGGWRPLGCHLRVGRDRKPLRSGSGDVNGTKNKSGEHLTRHGNLAKKSRSKKVFTLKGKKNSFKAKQPNFKKRRLQTLWLYLIAAFDQMLICLLPSYRSTLCRNLNLSCEAEVEMQCGGKIVNPGMTLHDLADCFLDKGPKSRVRSSVGSPATGFVATLFYGRPELPPPPPESCHG